MRHLGGKSGKFPHSQGTKILITRKRSGCCGTRSFCCFTQGYSAPRRGLLLYRNKSNQNSSQGQAPWVSPFTGDPNVPRSSVCGTRSAKRAALAPLARFCGAIIGRCFSRWSALWGVAPPLGGLHRRKSAQTDCWGENPAPRCVKTNQNADPTGRLAPFSCLFRRGKRHPSETEHGINKIALACSLPHGTN